MPFTGLYVSRVKNGTLSNLDYVTGDLCQAAIFARDLVETFSVCYYFSGNYTFPMIMSQRKGCNETIATCPLLTLFRNGQGHFHPPQKPDDTDFSIQSKYTEFYFSCTLFIL